MTVLGLARLHFRLTELQLARREANGGEQVLMWSRFQPRDHSGKNFLCVCTFDDGLADEAVPFELPCAIDLSSDWRDRIEFAIDAVPRWRQ